MIKRISCFLISVFLIFSLAQAKEEWETLDSTHFIIYYRSGAYDFSLKVKEKAEEYYRRIKDELGFLGQESFLKERRVKIYIYNTQDEYIKGTNQPDWSGGCANYKDRSISGFRLANGFLFQVLPHELGHVVFREFIGFNPNIPTWLDEGIACYVEPQRIWASKRVIRSALRENKFIPLNKLSDTIINAKEDKEIIELFYAESVSVVDFLIKEFGKEKFTQFCLNLKEWATIEEALSKFYPYKNLEEFNEAWVVELE